MYYPDLETFKKLSREGNLIPVYREILADVETPVTALSKLAARSHVFLLESVEGGEKWGRYSFLGADPRVVFRVLGEEVEIRNNGQVQRFPHGGDPLRYLQELLKKYRPVPSPGLPRFYGGAVGYLGYGMVRYFEKLPTRAPDDLGTDEAVFLLTDTILVFDNIRHTIKIVACAFIDENGSPTSPEEIYREATRKIDALMAVLQNAAPLPTLTPSVQDGDGVTANMTAEDFKAMVRQAKEYILNGDIIQAVLSQRFQIDNNIDPLHLYRALRFVNPSPYLFFLKAGDMTLIGSSPEVLVRLEEGVAELRPIAGTRRRGRTEQEDRIMADELLQDPKEKAEHVMLVDLGRNDLGRIAQTGSVQVNQLMAVERYSHVMHLVSHIQAQLAAGKDAFDVIRAAFPAGTLTGAPKVRAMEIIEELEPHQRGPYGGAVGYFSFTGNMDFGITIRTMLLKDNRIFIQAGAGIVADSDPDAEYQETKSKAAGMLKAIRLAASGFEIMDL
jgi:anthranilate synthase component 1